MTYWRQQPGQSLGPIDPHITVVASNTDALVDKPVRILGGMSPSHGKEVIHIPGGISHK